MDHIHLAKWADLAILYPASANTINALAAGLSDNVIGSLFLAWERSKPYWIAPAMNPAMLAHPATQRSLRTLKEWGVKILEPETGHHACGDLGPGRLTDPDQTVRDIFHLWDRTHL